MRHHTAKVARRLVPRNPSIIFLVTNARKLRFNVFLLFCARKYMASSFYLVWTEFTRNYDFFFPIMDPRGPELNCNKFTISYEFSLLQVKG